MKCDECDLYKDVYLSTLNLVREGIISDSPKFIERLLIDFEEHITEDHPERAEAFLKNI